MENAHKGAHRPRFLEVYLLETSAASLLSLETIDAKILQYDDVHTHESRGESHFWKFFS